MRRRRVGKGRQARDRRYEAALARQVALVRHALTVPRPRPMYAHPSEFLRPGDCLDRFAPSVRISAG